MTAIRNSCFQYAYIQQHTIETTEIRRSNDRFGVNSILVTIYDSLEQMYGDLCLDLELHSKSGFLKYKKDKSDVLMNFI